MTQGRSRLRGHATDTEGFIHVKKYPTLAGMIGICLSMQPLTEATAAVYAERPISGATVSQVAPIQFAPDRRHGGPNVRAHPGWRGGPGWRGAGHWRGPSGWSGRPYWYGRPWVRRPYYGTIIAGVALGTHR